MSDRIGIRTFTNMHGWRYAGWVNDTRFDVQHVHLNDGELVYAGRALRCPNCRPWPTAVVELEGKSGAVVVHHADVRMGLPWPRPRWVFKVRRLWWRIRPPDPARWLDFVAVRLAAPAAATGPTDVTWPTKVRSCNEVHPQHDVYHPGGHPEQPRG